jgi:signal-transduction protein with cAMP-binding, CBS, and nucleotidyltransferase domain
MKVRDLCQRRAVTVEREAPIPEVARLMADMGVGSVVVVHDGSVCGILTDRDIVTRGVRHGRDVRALPVAELMTADPVVVDPEETVARATVLMAQKQVRRLPVVGEGRLFGILALDDVLALVSDELANLRAAITAAVTP